MRIISTVIGVLVIICLTALAVEFPGSKEEQKTVTVMSEGKAFAEVKILALATIEANGADISIAAQQGNKRTMKVKDGSVEIRPENGKPLKITGELIYIFGSGKSEKK